MPTTKSIKKLVSFSPVLYQHARNRAETLGLSFSEYLRFLLAEDIRKQPVTDIELLPPEMEKGLGESLTDYADGRYTVLKTQKDIKNFINNL